MIKIKWGQIIFCLLISSLITDKSFGKQQMTKAIFGIPLEAAPFKEKTAEQIAKYLKGCGINAVVEVPLDNSIIEQLHRNGLKAYAEMGLFCGKEHWEKHPASRPVLADGSLAQMDGWYAGVCPSQQWLIDGKIKEAEDIARKYEIDGLWLDFIRWPTRWEVEKPKIQYTCFCDSCLERFQRQTGVKIPERLKSTGEISGWIYKNHSPHWYRWRCDVIVETVKKIREAVNKYRKEAVIGIFVVPWREADFDDAIYKVIGQDVKELSRVVDVFSPMSYHLLCHKDPDWIISVTKELKSKTQRQVWPIVQSIDEPTAMSAKEYERALEAALAGGSAGVMTFNTATTLEGGKWEVQKKVFTKQ